MAPAGFEGQEYAAEAVKAAIKYFPEAVDYGRVPDDYPYTPPFTRYEAIPHYTKVWPHRTIGKLYFSQGGGDYFCTASSIGGYAVWTAGHCVSDGAGTWSTNYVFVPAEMDGSPAVAWAVWDNYSAAWTFTDWHYDGELCRDSGGVVFHPNPQGKPVSVVGWLGFAWNWDPDQHWHEIGYPGDLPFDGSRQIVCASSRSRADEICVFGDNPPTMGAGCDQTPGCSGGPWIMHYTPWFKIGGNYINGNFSYHWIGWEEEKFSPYFDDASFGLYDVLINDVPVLR
jgi:V8-like Glu-specific endopeptidase